MNVGTAIRLGRGLKVAKGKKLKSQPVDLDFSIRPREEDGAPAHVEVYPTVNITLAKLLSEIAVVKRGPALIPQEKAFDRRRKISRWLAPFFRLFRPSASSRH